MSGPPESLEPRADADAVVDDSPAATATTAARALVLGAALTKPSVLDGLDRDLIEIGLGQTPHSWAGWPRRMEILKASDVVLARYALLDEVTDREESGWVAGTATTARPERSARVDLWREVRARQSPPEAVAWLRMLMTDREPIAAAAAAAGLSHWQPSKDTPVPASLSSARTSLTRYANSASQQAREIAQAALGSSRGTRTLPGSDIPRGESGKTVSVMVHGTNAYAGDWWFVGGDFHSYVKANVRPDVFSGRNTFSWSGKYKKKDRQVAAERFAGWARDTIGGPLNTVFAHSYGGVIALNATSYGLKMSDLVLLSVPVEEIPVEWRNVGRAVSLRIHLDLVLLAARRRQYFSQNVDEHHMERWFWHHGDSHDPRVWQQHGWAGVLSL